MTQIFVNLLNSLKKANAATKQKMAEKNGFSTPEEFEKYLLKQIKRKIKTEVGKVEVTKPLNKEELKTAKKVKVKVDVKPETRTLVDKVIAFDTTGSMSSYIGNVKKHVTDLIPQLFETGDDLRVRIIAFGDYCDMPDSKTFGNAFQDSGFTNDQNKLISFVKSAKDTGGGDGDEFYELVIKKIIEETPWREGSDKSVLFIADADPHSVGYTFKWSGNRGEIRNKIDWKVEAKKAADLKIQFDTLAIHGNRFLWYQELAEITNGIYLPFQSSEKMSEVVTASTYVRGSKMSKVAFTTSMSVVMDGDDEELKGVYKALSKKL